VNEPMPRDKIVRNDFRTVRKGWDPREVREHLRAVAELLEDPPGALAKTATERLSGVIEAAERAAAELQSEARERAESQTSEARAEAKKLVDDAKAEAETVVTEARAEAKRVIGAGHEDAKRRMELTRKAIADLLDRADKIGEQLEAERSSTEVPEERTEVQEERTGSGNGGSVRRDPQGRVVGGEIHR